MFLNIFSYNWTDPLRPDWSDASGKVYEKYANAFEVFNIPVKWYAIMILCAIILSVVIGYFGFAKRLGVNSDHLFEGVMVGVVAGIVGARLWFVVANIFEDQGQSAYILNPMNIFAIRDGGLAISGGVLLAGIALFFYSRFRHLKFLYLLEIVLPLIMISQVLGRWGNFFNLEAHGGLILVDGWEAALESANGKVITDNNFLQAQRDFLWFFPDFMIDRMYIYDGTKGVFGYCHPCFFYEGMLNFIGFTAYMLIRRFVKKGIYVGDGLSFYLIWYGIVRFFVEHLRTDAQMIKNTDVHIVVVYAVIMVIVGVAWFIIRRVKKIAMIPCHEALYGFDSTIYHEHNKKEKNKDKSKQNKQEIKVEAEA